MGGIIKAICECGFETDLMTGSSANNYHKVCNAPALCLNCSKLLTNNYLSDDTKCSTCDNPVTFYNDSSLHETAENNMESVYFFLPEGNCLCPACGKMKMRFIHTGCWD